MWIFLENEDEFIRMIGNDGLSYVSARTIRVRLAFSIVNFVLPSWPAMRPENA
jgi:hypothetical protein